jgi:hypothetical protein
MCPDLNDLLSRLSACPEARDWAATQPDPATAWATCERGDWMLWLAARLLPRERVVLAACDCAELAAPHWTPEMELACVWALDAARRWARGEADLEEVQAAADAAYAAYAAAYAANAAAAAYAANAAAAAAAAAYAYAAYAAYAAAAAAANAAYAAYAAAYAAADAAYAAYAAHADIVREHITAEDICRAAEVQEHMDRALSPPAAEPEDD